MRSNHALRRDHQVGEDRGEVAPVDDPGRFVLAVDADDQVALLVLARRLDRPQRRTLGSGEALHHPARHEGGREERRQQVQQRNGDEGRYDHASDEYIERSVAAKLHRLRKRQLAMAANSKYSRPSR